MDDNTIFKLIRNFNNDENVIKLKNYYNSLSFMEILGVDRLEKAHSSFFKWLFDENYNYDLQEKPLLLLLDLLVRKDTKNTFDNVKKDIVLRSLNINVKDGVVEFPLGEKQKYGRCDIYIPFDIGTKQYAIIVENKVFSQEKIEKVNDKNEYQTDKYFNYFNSLDNGITYIYVFLAPIFDNKETHANNPNFINISYDDIVESIINPLLLDDNLGEITRSILLDYLKVLSKPNILDPNSKSISMVSNKNIYEAKLIGDISDKHSKLGDYLKNSSDENEILKNFLSNNINMIISASIWPEILKKNNRNRNVSFKELGIEPGTVLYLAAGEKKNERDENRLFVTTLDLNSKVQYKFENEVRINSISTAARELAKKDYGLRGINWFIYNNNGKDINLFYYYENLKEI